MIVGSNANGIQQKKRIRSAALFCVCVFLATFAASLSVGDDARVYMDPNAVLAVIVLFSSILLFRPLLRSSRPTVSPVVVCVALMFALFTVLGMQLDAGKHTLVLRGAVIGSAETSSGLVGCALMVVAFVGFTFFYYALVSLVYEKLAEHIERTSLSRTAINYLFGQTYHLSSLRHHPADRLVALYHLLLPWRGQLRYVTAARAILWG